MASPKGAIATPCGGVHVFIDNWLQAQVGRSSLARVQHGSASPMRSAGAPHPSGSPQVAHGGKMQHLQLRMQSQQKPAPSPFPQPGIILFLSACQLAHRSAALPLQWLQRRRHHHDHLRLHQPAILTLPQRVQAAQRVRLPPPKRSMPGGPRLRSLSGEPMPWPPP